MLYAKPIGPELDVNTLTTGYRSAPTISGIGNGNFIVVWSEDNNPATTGLRGQIYAADGTKIGAEFDPTSSGSAYRMGSPAVTRLDNGHVVVTWDAAQGSGGGPYSQGVRGQILDASGATVGGEFAVKNWGTTGGYASQTTALKNGGFVATWYDYSASPGSDGSASSVKGQVFDASGNAVGSQFLVNTQKSGFQWYPSVTTLDNGNFVAAWTDNSQTDGDVKGQLFSSTGTKLGGEFVLNTVTSDYQGDVKLTSLAGGGFVAVWTDGSQFGTAADYEVKAQIFGTSGQKIGGEFVANTVTKGSQANVSVASLSNGGFVVTWDDRSGTRGDTDGAVAGQAFDATGAKLGDEFLVNTTTSGLQSNSAVVGLPNGSFAVTWTDALGSGFQQIHAQVFELDQSPAPAAPVLDAILSGNRLTGTADADTSIALSDGTTLLATVTAATDGRFSFQLPTLASGHHDLTAVATAAIGGTSATSDVFAIEVGTAAEVQAHFAAYASESDLDAIIVTDRASFVFDSKAALDQAVTDYAGVLAKIVAGYSFTVSITGAAEGGEIVTGDGADRLVVDLAGWNGGTPIDFSGGSGVDTLQLSAAGASMPVVATIQPDGSVSFEMDGRVVVAGPDVERFVITGSDAGDTLAGSSGGDWLNGGGGADYFLGSAGNDAYVFDDPDDRVVGESANGGTDTIWTTVSVDLRDNPNVENLRLQSGHIDGTGSGGANLITGSSGDNVIAGGAGLDTLYGKGGADTFKFAEFGAANRDAIWDFDADDHIQLDRTVFTGLTEIGGVLDAADFVIGTRANADHAQVIYNKATGILSYDADGKGSTPAQDIAFIGKNLGFVDHTDILIV